MNGCVVLQFTEKRNSITRKSIIIYMINEQIYYQFTIRYLMYNTLCSSNTRHHYSLKILDHFHLEHIWFYWKTFKSVKKSVWFTILYFFISEIYILQLQTHYRQKNKPTLIFCCYTYSSKLTTVRLNAQTNLPTKISTFQLFRNMLNNLFIVFRSINKYYNFM